MDKWKPDFNRFLAAVTRKHLPDRLPLCELEVDLEIMEAFMGHPITSLKDRTEFWVEAGYDYSLLSVRGQPLPEYLNQSNNDNKHAVSTSKSHDHSTYDVAVGVKDEKSFEDYPWIGPDEINYSEVDSIRNFLPDGMKLVVNHGPLFSGMWRVMGLESFSIACYENPSLIKAIAERMGALSVEIVKNVLQRDWVGAIWIGDDMAYTTSLMVSPDFMRTYVFPYYRRFGDLCKQYNKPLILHSDGNFTAVYEDLIECGVQAVHPNEPTSVNIVELKKKYGDRLSFLGGMDTDLMSRGTVDEVINAVRYLIDNIGPGGGFAPGGGNSITNYIPLKNYRALIKTIKEFGNIY